MNKIETVKALYNRHAFKLTFEFESIKHIEDESYAIIDTGAQASTTSIAFLSAIVPSLREHLEKLLEESTSNSKTYTLTGSIKSVPIILRNVCIGGFHIDEFRCYVNNSPRVLMVLGLDFLKACKLGLYHECCYVFKPELDYYKEIAKDFYKLSEIVEVNYTEQI